MRTPRLNHISAPRGTKIRQRKPAPNQIAIRRDTQNTPARTQKHAAIGLDGQKYGAVSWLLPGGGVVIPDGVSVYYVPDEYHAVSPTLATSVNFRL